MPTSPDRDVRLGVDIVDVVTFRSHIEQVSALKERLFHAAELAYCETQCNPWAHLAARFASKEALFKALGTGWTSETDYLHAAVMKNAEGAPFFEFSGPLAARLNPSSTISRLSLSHSGGYAMAVVMLENAQPASAVSRRLPPTAKTIRAK